MKKTISKLVDDNQDLKRSLFIETERSSILLDKFKSGEKDCPYDKGQGGKVKKQYKGVKGSGVPKTYNSSHKF